MSKENRNGAIAMDDDMALKIILRALYDVESLSEQQIQDFYIYQQCSMSAGQQSMFNKRGDDSVLQGLRNIKKQADTLGINYRLPSHLTMRPLHDNPEPDQGFDR